ncbi:MAG: hypothetical protein ACI857_001028 [Arenicella sp.]|jgi:hypothetical protein
MNPDNTFQKRLYGFCLSLIVFLILIFIERQFDILSYYNDENPAIWKVFLSGILWNIPLLLILYWHSADSENKKPLLVALSIFAGFQLVKGFLVGALDDSDYSYYWMVRWWSEIGLAISFGVFGLLKYETNKGWYFALIPLLVFGNSMVFNSYQYVDAFDRLFRLIGLRDTFSAELFSNGLRVDYLIQIVILVISYIPVFLVAHYIMRAIKNPKLFNFTLTRIEIEEEEMSKLSFSIIFWSFRIYVLSILLNNIEYYGFYMQEDLWLMIALLVIMCAVGVYVFISVYRNFLVAFTVKLNNYPSWQFLGLNIPILNIFVWWYTLSLKPTEKEDGDIVEDDLLDNTADSQIDSPDFGNLKQRFLKSGKNQGIKGLLLALLLLSLFLPVIIAGGVRGSSALSYLVVITFVTLAFFAWYVSDYRAAFILSALILVLALVLGLWPYNSYGAENVLVSLVNIFLYFAVFHFDKIQLYSPKKAEVQVDDFSEDLDA